MIDLVEDGTLSFNGLDLELRADAYDLKLYVVNGINLDRLALPAMVNVRELLVATGRILSTFAEMPKTLCLASIVEMAVQKLIDSGVLTQPKRPAGTWSLVEGSFDLSRQQLIMVTHWSALTVTMKSPAVDLVRTTEHEREHLRALSTLLGWLLSGFINQPTTLPVGAQLTPVADAIEVLAMALGLYYQKMLTYDQLTDAFAENTRVPVAQVLACVKGL